MSSPSTVVIIGGTRGIGLELVKQAATLYPQATIFATARDPAKATDLQTLADSNKKIQIITADAKDGHSLQLAAEKVSETAKSVDHIIYNAGVLSGWGSILEAGINGLKENIDINVYGAYYASLHFTPLLLKSQYKKKSLVLVTSNFASLAMADEIYQAHTQLFGTHGYEPTALYNVSKTALNRLGKELDQVLRPQGLPVLLIHPGLVKTDMNAYGAIDTTESAAGMLKVIGHGSTSSPLYVDYNGNELPW